jgi:hypothetical protein
MDAPEMHVNDARLLLEAARELEEFARWQIAYLTGEKRQRGAPGWTSASWAYGHARRLRDAVEDAG